MVYKIKLYQRWKKDHTMKDKKRIENLLKFIKRNYDKNPELQELIDVSMVDLCTEECISPELVFFSLIFLALVFTVMGYRNKRVTKINFCVWRKQFMKILGFILKISGIFNGNQEKESCRMQNFSGCFFKDAAFQNFQLWFV